MNLADGPARLLTVSGLTISFSGRRVVEDLSFSVSSGRTLAIVGESGSGKSITSLSILRLVERMGARFKSGAIYFNGQDLLKASEAEMQAIRGKSIAMIFQEPMTSLNPVLTIGDQIGEVLCLHEKINRGAAKAKARDWLKKVRLPDAERLLTRYPHQLSGGMRQRVMIAMALACRPKLLIADEPTTALDVTIQAQILNLLRELRQELGMGMIFITHDMGVVAEMADEVIVLWRGRKVEQGSVRAIFANPQHPYTRTLLSAVPRLGCMTGEAFPKRQPLILLEEEQAKTVGAVKLQDTARYDAPPLLSVRDLVVRFDVRRNFWGKATHSCSAVSKVSFDLYPGETLALVGESGSGKSTVGRSLQQLQAVVSGEIFFQGQSYRGLSAAGRFRLRQEIQSIFQDPFAALDPRKTVAFSIAEPILTHGLLSGAKAVRRKVDALLERVGLSPAHGDRYPHQFSGGQRQRICIARALAADPKLIIADEALSALDVSIQAQILDLFMELQAERGLAYLFISHDMAVVEKISHRVVVLYLGQIMEMGSRRRLFETPGHAYTQRLLAAVPVADPMHRRRPIPVEDEIPNSVHRVGGEPVILAHEEIHPGHFIAKSA